MDTLHAPTPAPARDKAVNGGHAHVITSLNSPLLPPKVAHVAPPAHVPPTHMASPLLRHRTPVAGSPLLAHHQRHPPAPADSPKTAHKEPPPAHSSPATGQCQPSVSACICVLSAWIDLRLSSSLQHKFSFIFFFSYTSSQMCYYDKIFCHRRLLTYLTSYGTYHF